MENEKWKGGGLLCPLPPRTFGFRPARPQQISPRQRLGFPTRRAWRSAFLPLIDSIRDEAGNRPQRQPSARRRPSQRKKFRRFLFFLLSARCRYVASSTPPIRTFLDQSARITTRSSIAAPCRPETTPRSARVSGTRTVAAVLATVGLLPRTPRVVRRGPPTPPCPRPEVSFPRPATDN
jgi:hypothetical protein